MNENDIERLLTALESIAEVLRNAYDPENRAIRLYDVKRAEVYKQALAPEVKDKFGMKHD